LQLARFFFSHCFELEFFVVAVKLSELELHLYVASHKKARWKKRREKSVPKKKQPKREGAMSVSSYSQVNAVENRVKGCCVERKKCTPISHGLRSEDGGGRNDGASGEWLGSVRLGRRKTRKRQGFGSRCCKSMKCGGEVHVPLHRRSHRQSCPGQRTTTPCQPCGACSSAAFPNQQRLCVAQECGERTRLPRHLPCLSAAAPFHKSSRQSACLCRSANDGFSSTPLLQGTPYRGRRTCLPQLSPCAVDTRRPLRSC
jgi:hypothetical protein